MAALSGSGAARLLGLALLLGLLMGRVADPQIVSNLRHSAFDLYQQLSPREVDPQPVSIVDIDDPSLEEFGQWPWPRTRMADLVERITQAGAVAMAFDIVFSEPDRLSPDKIASDNTSLPETVRDGLNALPANDAVFARAIAGSRVILGQTSVRSAAANRETDAPMRDVAHAFIGGDPAPYLMRFPDILQNLPVLEDAAAGRGMFSVRPDADGIYRRVPLAMMVQGKIRLGLAPELLRVATGGDAFAVRVNDAGVDGVVLARQLVRTEADGTVWPHFSGSLRTRYVSAADLLAGRMPEGRLKGHLVLIGTSAIGLEDFRPTPLGVPMPGVEIHAQLLENILSQSMLVRPNYAIGAELAATAGLSLLVIVLVPMLGAHLVIALTLVLAGGYAGLSWYLFDSRGLLIDPVWPALSVVGLVMLMSSLNYIREERMRQQIRGAFGQYVSPDLVAKLADNPDSLALGGERRDLTILFSDVRGFTALAEGFRDDPAGLTTLMNRFLTILSQAILDRRGTIDKFMGDAIMAFWNAPLDTPDHEAEACRAALQMQADIERFNSARAETARKSGKVLPPIDVGIGLNTGDCIVGNMGSDSRFDYTALGDPVNLASRLEGQSKAYGLRILLGERTARRVEDRFALIELDSLRVKGKSLPERIFGLLGDDALRNDPEFSKLRDANDAMRAAYAGQDWQTALDGCDRLEAQGKAMDLEMAGYAGLYRARIAAFMANPPGHDWDGVYVADSK